MSINKEIRKMEMNQVLAARDEELRAWDEKLRKEYTLTRDQVSDTQGSADTCVLQQQAGQNYSCAVTVPVNSLRACFDLAVTFVDNESTNICVTAIGMRDGEVVESYRGFQSIDRQGTLRSGFKSMQKPSSK